MRGLLGKKIGEGVSADVHAWAPGQVVKLFKSAASRRLGWHEAQKTDAVFAAGAPAPQVFGVVTPEGRLGIVLSRLDGPTLLQLLRTGAMTREQVGATPRGPLPWRSQDACAAGGAVPARLDGRLVAGRQRHGSEAHRHRRSRLDRAPVAGQRALPWRHPPGNVIMTAEGPRLVDWTGTIRGPAALDLAFSHIILTEFAPEVADDPERPRAVYAAMQSEYVRLAGLSPAALTAAIGSYLPIVRVLFPRRRVP